MLACVSFVAFGFGLSFSIAFAQTSMAFMGVGWVIWQAAGGGLVWHRTKVNLSLWFFLALTFVGVIAGKSYGIHVHDSIKALGLPLILPVVASISHHRPVWAHRALRAFLMGVGLNAIYALSIWAYEANTGGSYFTRVHGSFGMVLTYAEITAMGVVFALGKGLAPKEKVLGRIGIPLAIAGLVFSYSRGAYIGFLLGLGAVALLRWRKNFVPILAGIASLLCIWLVLPFLIDTELLRPSARRLIDPISWSDQSSRARFHMLRLGGEMILDHPLGVGPGNVLHVFPDYIPLELAEFRRDGAYGHLHNNFYQVAAERGLPGLAAWLWFLIVWFLTLYRKMKKGSSVARGVLASGVVFLACGLTEYTLGDSEVAMLFWFLSGIGLAAREKDSDYQSFS